MLPVVILLLPGVLHAQTGYIYVHAKTISQDLSQSFTYSVSGGSTVVPNFTLLDQQLNIEPTDIGAGHGTGAGELWVVAGATQGASGYVYHRNVNSTTWSLLSGLRASAIDGADKNHFVAADSVGDAYVYNGASFFKIFDHSAMGSKAMDIANNASISSGTGFTAVVDSKGHVKVYTGNYTTTTTWNDVTPTDNGGGSFKRLDVNPATNDIVLTDQNGYITTINSSGGNKVYLGRGTGASAGTVDVAVDNYGDVYGMSQDAQGMAAVYRYDGSSWKEEPETGLHYFLTCGEDGQTWVIKGQTAAQSSSFANPSTIYTRVGDGSGTWLDDERVQTTQNDNAIMIPVTAGTYTISQNNPAGWNLQKVFMYDSANGSVANVATNSVSLVVKAGQVVHVLFINGIVSPQAIPGSCGTDNIIQNFGSGTIGSRGGPLTGLTDFHFYSDPTLNTTPDGYYSRTQNSLQWGNSTLTDHTGLTGGYFLMVNASYAPNEFYRQRITGMIPGAQYTMTFWAANLSPSSPLIPNILAGITDTASGLTLGSVSTALPTDNAWHEYTFSFTATVTTGDIFLQNNANGGFGNDLAIDDIGFTQACNVLPLTLSSFSAVAEQTSALLHWDFITNPSLDHFDIQRSTDQGLTWSDIGTEMAATGSAMTQQYNYTDASARRGTDYYRLKMTDRSGAVSFSSVRSVEIGGTVTQAALTLYPNPVATAGKLQIQLQGFTPGTGRILLMSTTGQALMTMGCEIPESGIAMTEISTARFPAGMYVIMASGSGRQVSKTILIENQ